MDFLLNSEKLGTSVDSVQIEIDKSLDFNGWQNLAYEVDIKDDSRSQLSLRIDEITIETTGRLKVEFNKEIVTELLSFKKDQRNLQDIDDVVQVEIKNPDFDDRDKKILSTSFIGASPTSIEL